MRKKEAKNIFIMDGAEFISTYENASSRKYKDYYLSQYGNK